MLMSGVILMKRKYEKRMRNKRPLIVEDEEVEPMKISDRSSISSKNARTRFRFFFKGWADNVSPEIMSGGIAIDGRQSLYVMVRKIGFNSPRVRAFFNKYTKEGLIEGELEHIIYRKEPGLRSKFSYVGRALSKHTKLSWVKNKGQIIYLSRL